MSFHRVMEAWSEARIQELYANISQADVEAALGREDRSPRDLAALLSPQARPYLEAMAREGQRLTRWHFGRTISLYAPIYISNLCCADCVYCGFAARSGNREKRTTLSPEAIDRECQALAAYGYDNILLLTGEAPKVVPVSYIAEAVAIARRHFSSVGVEIYALDEAGYKELVDSGLESATLYMETYARERYHELHLAGQKMDYDFRLDAIERAGRAGTRKLSIGALLGLYDWRFEIIWMALHARYLQQTCWQSAINVSFPRLRHTPERFSIDHAVSDIELVQIMLALRLFLPEVGFNLSTREEANFRDHLIPLGVTAMSAGSSTKPGGYEVHNENAEQHAERPVLEQFEVEDTRSPQEVVAAIRKAGYDPVWKDFDHAFDETDC